MQISASLRKVKGIDKDTLNKILFSSNFGMQISAKICDYLKNNKNLNPFEISN